MKKAILLFPVLVVLSLFGTSSYAATVHIDIKDFFFDPGVVNINIGDTVIWENKGAVPHTTTSGNNCTSDGKWDSGLLQPVQEFQRVFDEAGTFPFFCSLHCAEHGMVGTIIVSGQEPPPPQVQFNGTVSSPLKITSTVTDTSGKRKFSTSTRQFTGSIQMITKGDDLTADEGGCFVKLSGNDNTVICIKEKAFITTFNEKSKTDLLLLTGTGSFSEPSGGETVTGPVYLDTKGTIKKDPSGKAISISLTGKIAGGTTEQFYFSGNIKSTLTPSP